MNSLHIPGFPPPEEQDIIKFYFLKKLSYSVRIIMYIVLIIAGFALQLLIMKAWPGALFLVFASLINLVKGYDNRAELNVFSSDSSWTEVDISTIIDIQELDDRITKWDRDSLDISNPLGVVMFIFVFIASIILTAIFSGLTNNYDVGVILFTDAVILILPLWFNGIRRVLKQNILRVKISIIINMERHFHRIKGKAEHFKPALMLKYNNTGKSIPTDARFAISLDGMPADFYGIQAQININDVQGSSYPYFYCVIAAKNGFGLNRFISTAVNKPKKITIEFQQDNNAEVIVIRQSTTKTSGYHTDMPMCGRILETSLALAKAIQKAVL